MLDGRRRDAEPGMTRRDTERKKRRDFGFDDLSTILEAVWPENIQKQGTRRETGRIQVSSVQCISIVEVMLRYINNGNSGVLLGTPH